LERLDAGCVLAPERYDPRRRTLEPSGPRLGDVAKLVREVVTPRRAHRSVGYLVLDTGDAYFGFVRTTRRPCGGEELGSAKKVLQPGQVVISRLRPYLKQVAYIDQQLIAQGVTLVGSTEFQVLASCDDRSIAFLVPFLLTDAVQARLSACQEGGHHPRFTEQSLLAVPLPAELLLRRDELSCEVEAAVVAARVALDGLTAAVAKASDGV
jgi:hypothetical protein